MCVRGGKTVISRGCIWSEIYQSPDQMLPNLLSLLCAHHIKQRRDVCLCHCLCPCTPCLCTMTKREREWEGKRRWGILTRLMAGQGHGANVFIRKKSELCRYMIQDDGLSQPKSYISWHTTLFYVSEIWQFFS